MQEIKISELIPHSRNTYFFDDISGENWEAFLESIKTSGVIEPIIADAKTKVIVSGHQRVRACKELHIEKVLCEFRLYDGDDKILKDLLETNLRQRGIGNTNPIKLGRCLVELERIYEIKKGGDRKSNSTLSTLPKSQDDLIKELGLNKDTYLNYKKLTTLIPDIQNLITNDTISPSVASRIISKLSEADQQKLVSQLPITDKLTQKRAEELIKNIKPQILDKTDYKTIGNLKRQKSDLENRVAYLEKEKEIMDRKIKLNQDDADKYTKMKKEMEFLCQQKNDLSRKLESATELSGLVVRIQHILENDLAPIKYKRCMDVLGSSDAAVENLEDVVLSVEKWTREIRSYLPTRKINVVDGIFEEIEGER